MAKLAKLTSDPRKYSISSLAMNSAFRFDLRSDDSHLCLKTRVQSPLASRLKMCKSSTLIKRIAHREANQSKARLTPQQNINSQLADFRKLAKSPRLLQLDADE